MWQAPTLSTHPHQGKVGPPLQAARQHNQASGFSMQQLCSCAANLLRKDILKPCAVVAWQQYWLGPAHALHGSIRGLLQGTCTPAAGVHAGTPHRTLQVRCARHRRWPVHPAQTYEQAPRHPRATAPSVLTRMCSAPRHTGTALLCTRRPMRQRSRWQGRLRLHLRQPLRAR